MGDPDSYVDSVHDAGGLVLHTVGSAEEARRAVRCGVDIVVAQGWEAGGHVLGGVATLPPVPAVVDAVAPLPVIAAGGIGDARGVVAVLALGAQAAWLGTPRLALVAPTQVKASPCGAALSPTRHPRRCVSTCAPPGALRQLAIGGPAPTVLDAAAISPRSAFKAAT
jgi:hypothetical protein